MKLLTCSFCHVSVPVHLIHTAGVRQQHRRRIGICTECVAKAHAKQVIHAMTLKQEYEKGMNP